MNSVTFSALVGGDGSTVTDDSNPLTGLANGGHIERFVPALAQIVSVATTAVSSATNAMTNAESSLVSYNATAALNATASAAASSASASAALALAAQSSLESALASIAAIQSAINALALQLAEITLTKSLTISTDWQDTGIYSDALATGTYAVQLIANDTGAGGNNSNEYYSGTMSWYSGDTNSSLSLPTDEIPLHRAGGSGEAGMYLRTFRTPTADSHNLKLQIYSNTANPSSSNYVFKFRRLI